MTNSFRVRLPALFALAVLSCLILACGSESAPAAPQAAATTEKASTVAPTVITTASSTTTAPTTTVATTAPATSTTVRMETAATLKFPSPWVPTLEPTSVPPTAKADAAPSPEKKARLVQILGDRYKDTTSPPIISQAEALKALLKQPAMVFNLETQLDKMTAFYGLFENREVWIFNFDKVNPIVSMATSCPSDVKGCVNPKAPTNSLVILDAHSLKPEHGWWAYPDD